MSGIEMTERSVSRLTQRKALLDRANLWEPVFDTMGVMATQQAVDGRLSIKTASTSSNAARNQYNYSVPFDQNIVKIKRSLRNFSGYINASTVLFKEVGRQYIMAPIPPFLERESFWRMVVEQEVPGIVLFIQSFDQRRLDLYFPPLETIGLGFGNFEVVCEEYRKEESYIYRLLSVKQGKSTRMIPHFTYLGNPDSSDPKEVQDFVEFYHAVCESGLFLEMSPAVKKESFVRFKPSARSKAPIIQCGSGAGRSGMFIVFDVICQVLQQNMTGNCSVEDTIFKLRMQRKLGVEIVQQYKFIYDAIFTFIDDKMPALSKLKGYVKRYVDEISEEAANFEIDPDKVSKLLTLDSVLNEELVDDFVRMRRIMEDDSGDEELNEIDFDRLMQQGALKESPSLLTLKSGHMQIME